MRYVAQPSSHSPWPLPPPRLPLCSAKKSPVKAIKETKQATGSCLPLSLSLCLCWDLAGRKIKIAFESQQQQQPKTSSTPEGGRGVWRVEGGQQQSHCSIYYNDNKHPV